MGSDLPTGASADPATTDTTPRGTGDSATPSTGTTPRGTGTTTGTAPRGAGTTSTTPRGASTASTSTTTASAAGPTTTTTSTSTPPTPTGPTTSTTADVADLCDEANCVLSDYDRPCCAKYKAKGPELAKRVGGVPETLDRSMVRAGVDTIKPRVIACGEKAGVKGTVKIAVVVSAEGAVTSSELQDSPDPTLGSCVATALRSAKFGKSVEGGSFTYPFVF
jgi:hypothetical protein